MPIEVVLAVKTGVSHLMAEDMQAQRKKDDVVDYVHESGVDRRASRSANVIQ